MIKTILGDALIELKKVPDSSIDLIATDPPYNLGKDYGNNGDSLKREEYLQFTKDWLCQAKRVLKPTGSIYVFMGVQFISYLYMIMRDELGFQFNSWITWHYTQGMGKKKGFSPRHDDILFFTKSKKFIFNLDLVRVPQKFYRSRNNMRGANPGDVWKFSHVHYSNPNRQNHPTQKPEGLFERIILASSNKKETVLDPFSGSGTAQRVCQQLDRSCIGIEINPEYVELTKKRLKEHFEEFDSIDERLYRLPNDLRNETIRNKYLKMHVKHFLKNHKSYVSRFYEELRKKYGQESFDSFTKGQSKLL